MRIAASSLMLARRLRPRRSSSTAGPTTRAACTSPIRRRRRRRQGRAEKGLPERQHLHRERPDALRSCGRAMKNSPVTLYTAPVCRSPAPRRARAQRARRAVQGSAGRGRRHRQRGAEEGFRRALTVPTLVVGRSVHKGFEAGAYDALLDSARYPRAGVAAGARRRPRRRCPTAMSPPGAAREGGAGQARSRRAAAHAAPYAPGAPRAAERRRP